MLMGPSGSGKSTLLQVLGCLRHPNTGQVTIEGTAIASLSENALSKLRCGRIGFVFQHYNLLPSLRAWENVAFALELQESNTTQVERRSRDVLSRLGLPDRADAFPSELSGGEKQRVAIARAVVGRPNLLLADEPTAALDSASGNQVARLLTEVAHEHGTAVVLVTHDNRITGFADRIATLDDGKIAVIKRNIKLQGKALQEQWPNEMEEPDHYSDRTGLRRGNASSLG